MKRRIAPSLKDVDTQAARVLACLVLLNFAVPDGAIVAFGVPAKEAAQKALAVRAAAQRELARRRAKSASRLLSDAEQGAMQGRSGENPYLAGGAKWNFVYKGIDVMTGNYSTSATDMSFDGGYGIPVNVTRSYSANNPDEGPFGKGWSLSADVRSTAGGLLKGGSAPVRSIPTSLKERAANEDDPNVAVEPAQAVTATDAAGTEETVQKDVDGILTPPAWDKNVYDSQYEWVTLNGQSFQVLVSNTVKTAEGTVYTYAKKGSYPTGTVPWNVPGAAATAANVLKVTSATDRQGNVTTYTYGSSLVSFSHSNGLTQENPLIGVSMPGGHHITLVWGTSGNAANRVTSVSDDEGGRTVHYGYGPGGLLTSVQTPGLKTTTYGYGAPWVKSGWNEGVAGDLLRTITDPRGLTTEIRYAMTYVDTGGFAYVPGAAAYRILYPNGTSAFVDYGSFISPDATPNQEQGNAPPDCLWPTIGASGHSCATRIGDKLGARLEDFEVLAGASTDVFDVVRHDFGGPAFSYSSTRSFQEYSRATEDLLVEAVDSNAGNTRGLAAARGMTVPFGGHRLVSTAKAYNFMGQPLRATTTEAHADTMGGALTTDRVSTVDYAYWGATKYYQQKAVRDQAGRYSFTEYYSSSALPGKRGQTERVYDPKHGGFTTVADAAHPAPPIANGQSQADYDAKLWKYTLHPSSDLNFSARFEYDAQGRPTDVWKLQKDTTSPWSYVQTHTTYGGDGASGTWGQASKVEEDFGGIDRTTRTNDYTAWGKACDVIDAAGHRFVTDFDADGQVNSVTRTDVSPSVPVVTYAYGSSGVSNGQPVSVVDGLSGVSQSISYAASGGGIGQPSGVTETDGSDSYSVGYAYDGAGDRATATYQTPSGTVRWGYSDYLAVGEPGAGSRAFQTLTRLDAAGDPTAEAMHYAYDSDGRLSAAAFAQSPYRDAGGRLASVATNWDALPDGGGAYAETGLFQNQCAYETAGLNRGLKTQSAFTVLNAASSGYDVRTESYGYDPDLDYLTSAGYGDGMPNATPSWTYDAAGNRASDSSQPGAWSYDALNRMTASPGFAYASDALGNRLSRTVPGGGPVAAQSLHAWDCLSRLATYSPGAGHTDFSYRADGMRVRKAYHSGEFHLAPVSETPYDTKPPNGGEVGDRFARYRYDGQMCVETSVVKDNGTVLIRQGLGARGVDLVETKRTDNTVTVSFPVYDAHGNQVASLSRNGSGGFALSDRRSYDAWGQIRQGAATGGARGRYCASLGHVQDDGTGLATMRA